MFDGVSFKPLLTGGEKSKSLYRILVESYRRVVMTERERTTGTFDGLSRILLQADLSFFKCAALLASR